MKMILVFLSSFFGTQIAARCQAMPGEKEQYEFLSWYIKTLKPQKLSDTLQPIINFSFKVSDIDGLPEKQSSLTKADKNYLKRQALANIKPQILDTGKVSYNDWKKKGDPALPVTTLSLPIFSKNKKMVLINSSFVCGGECGEGGIQFFVKLKGKWQLFPLDGLSHWIS